MTPSSPAPSKRWNQSCGDARGRGVHGREVDAAARRAASARSSRARRSACGRGAQVVVAVARGGRRRRTRPASPRPSFATRDAAGWRRSWSASKSSPRVGRDDDLAVDDAALGQAGARAARPARGSSGRAASGRGSGCRSRRRRGTRCARKPSHFGSKSQPSPAGSSCASFASIGSIGGSMGSRQPAAARRAAMRPSADGPARVEAEAPARRGRSRAARGRRASACPCAPRGRSPPTRRAVASGARRPAGGRCACRSSCGSCRRGSPTRCSARARGGAAGRRRRAPSAQSRAKACALRRRDVRPAVAGARVPDVDVGGRDVEVAAEHERLVGLRGLVEPAGEAVEPGELGLVEGRADRPAVRRVHADDADAAARRPRSSAPRRAARRRRRPRSARRRSGSPKFVTTSVDAARGSRWRRRSSGPRRDARARSRRRGTASVGRVGVGELGLLHQQHVRPGALEPPARPCSRRAFSELTFQVAMRMASGYPGSARTWGSPSTVTAREPAVTGLPRGRVCRCPGPKARAGRR